MSIARTPVRRLARAWSLAIAFAAVSAWALTAWAATREPVAPGAATPTVPDAPLIAILCYHDLSDAPGRDAETVSPQFLRQQIRACKQAGWTFMSLSELMAVRERPEQLPPRVMVLTFDDAYRSFHEHALTILREEGIKATLAVVTSFIDHPPAGMPPLMTWDEIRAADRGGWVEIASHSHDLHRYEMTNPYRDTGPSVTTRRYLAQAGRYEDREEYRARIRADLVETQRVLREKLGHSVPALVWPYGMHTEMSRSLANHAGFTLTLALGSRPVTPADLASGCVPRILVTKSLRFARDPHAWILAPQGAIRAARLRLDDLWDGDMTAYRARLDATIARLRAIGATHVFLDATSRPAGDGHILYTYFPGHQTAMRVDLWSMAAAKLSNARMRVWARVPSMNLTWAWQRHPEWRLGAAPHRIAVSSTALAAAPEARMAAQWPTRLSPELPDARRAAVDFYVDLAVYLPLDGILFEDDARVLTDETLASEVDASVGARAAAIDGLLHELEATVRAWRPECRFGRVTGADAVRSVGPSPESAHDFARMIGERELTVVSAEGDPDYARDPARWVETVSRRAIRTWRAEGRGRSVAAVRAGAVQQAPESVPPLLLELPVDSETSAGSAAAARLPALFALARHAGFESFGVGSVTPANQAAIPARTLEATLSAPAIGSR